MVSKFQGKPLELEQRNGSSEFSVPVVAGPSQHGNGFPNKHAVILLNFGLFAMKS